MAMVIVSWGCRDQGQAVVGEQGEPIPGTVVSLSPAITTTMIDLGEEGRLVGRTPWCRGIDDRPVVGTLEGVDAEILVVLKPAVVLHQPPATGSDPVLVGLRDRLGFTLVGDRLDGVDDLIRLLDEVERLGLASPERLRERRESISRIGAMAAGVDDPLAVLLHSIEPLGVAGRDTFLGELADAAGLRNAAGAGGWREWSIETLLSSQPDVVVLFTAGGSIDRARNQLKMIEWPRPPLQVIITNPDAFEPSTRMPRVLADLRSALGDAGVEVAPAAIEEVGRER